MGVVISPSIVRTAVPADREDIWRLFLMVHRENGIFPLAPERVEFFFNRALHPELIPPGDTGARGAIAVIGPPGKIEALCFVIIGQFWYTNSKHIEELVLYVDPEYRHSDHAKALIDWMKSSADRLGIPVLTGIMSNHRTQAKVRLYRRQLPEIGAFFLYPNHIEEQKVNGNGVQGQHSYV